MKNRTWSNEQKLMIVIEGFKNQGSVAELCNKHGIHQSQFYKWRDRLLKDGSKLFNHGGPDKEVLRLKNENHHLKHLIGDLTVELKKNEEVWS